MESQSTNLPAVANGKKATKSVSCPFCVGVFNDKESYIDHLINYHNVDWNRYQGLERPSVDKENFASARSKGRGRAPPKVKREGSTQIKQDVEEPGPVLVAINNEQTIDSGVCSHETGAASLTHVEKQATKIEDTKDTVIRPDLVPGKAVSDCSMERVTVLEGQPVDEISHVKGLSKRKNTLVTIAELALREKPNPELAVTMNSGQSNLQIDHAPKLVPNESDGMAVTAGVPVESEPIDNIADDQMELDIVPPSLVNQSSGFIVESQKPCPLTETCELKKNDEQAAPPGLIDHDMVSTTTSDAILNSALGESMTNLQDKIADSTMPLQFSPTQELFKKKKISLANYSKKKQQQQCDSTQTASRASNMMHKKGIASGGTTSIDTPVKNSPKPSLETWGGLLNPNQPQFTPAANAGELAPTPSNQAKFAFTFASASMAKDKESATKVPNSSSVENISKSSSIKRPEAISQSGTILGTKPDTNKAILAAQGQKNPATIKQTKQQVFQSSKRSDSQPIQFLSRNLSFCSLSEREDIDLDLEDASQEESSNNEPQNAQPEPEEFPILPNPILSKLGTSGALASFLKSKESEKAAEWNFWGPSVAPTVTQFKPLQATGVATNQPRLPLKGEPPREKDDTSSSNKPSRNLPLVLYQNHKNDQQKATSETDCVPQRNAIFLTDNGRVTTFPPGAVGSEAWEDKDDADTSMEDGEILDEKAREPDSGPQFSQTFVSRMRDLEDLQYDNTGFGHAGDIGYGRGDKRVLRGPVGGQLPVALRCPECCRFHQGKCGVPPEPCIICGGQHWAKQCNSKDLQIARIYRPGISCNRCLFMHKGSCPLPNACPVCLQVHDDLCLKPSGTCRYCGFTHWENACPRWEALDEEMGFSEKPKEDRRHVASDMQDKVDKYWNTKERSSNSCNQENNGNHGLGTGKCVTQTDFIELLSVEDEMKSLQPTYANAKALKRDIISVLRGKGVLGYEHPKSQRDYRSRSPAGRDNRHETKKTSHHEPESSIPTGPRNLREQGNYYWFDHDRTKSRTNTHTRALESSRKEPSHNTNPSNSTALEPSELRNRREDIWGRGRIANRNPELERKESYGRGTRNREIEPEGRDWEYRRREKDRGDTQHRRAEWEKEDRRGRSDYRSVTERLDQPEPPNVRQTTNERSSGLKEKSFNKRASSTDRPVGARTRRETVIGVGASGGLEKWGDFDSYTKRRRRE